MFSKRTKKLQFARPTKIYDQSHHQLSWCDARRICLYFQSQRIPNRLIIKCEHCSSLRPFFFVCFPGAWSSINRHFASRHFTYMNKIVDFSARFIHILFYSPLCASVAGGGSRSEALCIHFVIRPFPLLCGVQSTCLVVIAYRYSSMRVIKMTRFGGFIKPLPGVAFRSHKKWYLRSHTANPWHTYLVFGEVVS